jgi:hypothetical protein
MFGKIKSILFYSKNVDICFRLALYVYEYLLHVGAQKAAQTFLSEVRKILLNSSPSVLFEFSFSSSEFI